MLGGKALKNAKTRRCSTEEFNDISKSVIDTLSTSPDIIRTHVVRTHNSKTTHGDVDIITVVDPTVNMCELVSNLFIGDDEPQEIYKNDNCISFDHKGVQVDLICCEESVFETTKSYYDFSLGMYMGNIANSLGVKYGRHGLWLASSDGRVVLSTDPTKIFQFLGYDLSRTHGGFETEQDVFEYIATSSQFQPSLFVSENLTNRVRSRNMRNLGYLRFLNWLDSNHPTNGRKPHMHEFRLKQLASKFPEANVILEVKRLAYQRAKMEYARAKFSGKHISEAFGLDGKELGTALNEFKALVAEQGNMDYPDFILNHTNEELITIMEAMLTNQL